jgi:hypothetical protein
MAEVQAHGFSFEKWVCETFFAGYCGNYMQKWDVSAEGNRSPFLPVHWRQVPVSIKTAKYGSPIGLGDVLRQRQSDVPFIMIAGFWRQRTATEKWIEDIGAAYFSVEAWSALWGEVSLQDLRTIDLVVKNLQLHYTLARQEARAWKKATASLPTSRFVINPKIDSKSQRRIQCSLPFRAFWNAVGREPALHDRPVLFEMAFPNPIISSGRTFNA